MRVYRCARTIRRQEGQLEPQTREAGRSDGTYWIKWLVGPKAQWAGPFKDEWVAKASQSAKGRELKKGISAATNDAPAISLQSAIDEFLFERSASQDPNSVRRMRKELANFATVTKKHLLNQIARHDVFAYWTWLKDVRGSAPRTIYNRIQTLLTFLKSRGVVGLLKPSEMPEFAEKDVDYYGESNPEELKKFFGACEPEARIAFQFFLYSGAREREVMFAVGTTSILYTGRSRCVPKLISAFVPRTTAYGLFLCPRS